MRSSPRRAQPEAVQLSGGEPSIHPEILDMLAAAKARGIPLVMLNTNGIRLARDARFAPALAALGVHVYLQFDGFDDATHLAIRGRRLQAIKQAALDRCAAAGVGVSLAAAVERGINEHELGAIVRFGVEHPAVNGVFFQPVTHTGRHPAFDPLDRLTNVEVIRGLCAQLPEWFREDDFVAVPCCSPTCRSATYALYDGEDLVPLPRLVDVDRYLGFVTNRAVPDLEVAAALSGLFSASAAGGTERTGDRLECVACGVGLPDELQRIAARGFMVVAQDFQDEWTLDVAQAAQVLRRGDRPGRPDHPVLRVQRRGLPRAGPRRPGRRGERVIAGFSPLALDLETDPKGCCARLYESDAVRWLLDDQLHPGGERLTLRLAQLAGVAPGARVVDVACGSGATALLLARELGLRHGRRRPRRPRDRAGDDARRPPARARASCSATPRRFRSRTRASTSRCRNARCARSPTSRGRSRRWRASSGPGGSIAIADVTADLDALPAAAAQRRRAGRVRRRRPQRRRVRRAAARRRLRAARDRTARRRAARDGRPRRGAAARRPHARAARRPTRAHPRGRRARPPGDRRDRRADSLGYALITARVSGSRPAGQHDGRRRPPRRSCELLHVAGGDAVDQLLADRG